LANPAQFGDLEYLYFYQEFHSIPVIAADYKLGTMKHVVKNLLLIILLFIGGSAFSQSKTDVGIIIGNVLEDETAKPIEGATVSIFRSGDTTNKRSQLTDKNGNFDFEDLPFGYYRVAITSIGFAETILDSVYLRAERYDFNLGDIKLRRSSAQLSEVIVYAEKPLIENKDGKIIYNVGESAMSGGSSTAELLKSMPLINNDPNGKILLKGKEPKILIDDKPTELNAQQLADLLESLPGSSIEKIELMTNPPPQYASEAGGVINIVTKKGKVGVVGKVTISGGSRGEGNIASNISYRHKKFTLNSNAGFAASRYTGNNYSRRENYYTDSTNYFHTDGNFKNKNLRPNLRVQADYEYNKYQSFNIVLQSNYNFFDNYSTTQYTNLNRFNQVYKLSSRTNATQGDGHSNGLTLSYLLKGKNPAEKLQVIAAATAGKNDNGRDFHQQFFQPDFSPTGLDSLQQQAGDYLSNSLSLRVNYDKPFDTSGISLSTGVAVIRSNNHNILNTAFYKRADQQFVNNDLLSTNFRFHQDILSARAALSFRLKKSWRITAGAQVDQTFNTFQFIKGNAQDVKSTYVNVLPNVTIRKDFDRNFNTALIYRSTIRRPGIAELNPSVDYTDPYNIRFGNPYLLPSLAHNFDWNVGLVKGKYYFNTSVGLNIVKDVFNTIRTLADNGITEVTYQNIADRIEYESTLWGGYTFSKKLRMNASAGYTYNQYSEQEKRLYKYRDGGTFYTSINYSYMPTSLLTFDGNARYSSFSDPQGRAKSNLTMNLGVQRKFFNKRLIVSLTAIDPIKVQKFITYTYGTRFTLENYNSTNTRNFRVAVAYQLNKMQQKKLTDKQKKDAINKLKKM
jgi:ferric enterobactin receptor